MSSYEFEDNNGKLLLEDYDGRPWVLAKDVYTYIGYQNGSRDVRRHVSEKNMKVLDLPNGAKPKRGTPRRIFLSQEGVMELLVNAKQMEKTKGFREKFNNVVIPESIRRMNLSASAVLAPVQTRQVVELEERYDYAFKRLFEAQKYLSEQNTQILQQNEQVLATIDSIHSAMKISGQNWRDAARYIVTVNSKKNGADYSASYHEIYSELEKAMGVKLSVRRTNLQKKTGKKNIALLDVIAADKKLIPTFISVLRMYALRHDINVQIADEKGAA